MSDTTMTDHTQIIPTFIDIGDWKKDEATGQVPLIWTLLGNVPIEALEHRPQVIDGPRDIAFIDEYFYQGVSVKRGVSLQLKHGADGTMLIGNLGDFKAAGWVKAGPSFFKRIGLAWRALFPQPITPEQ